MESASSKQGRAHAWIRSNILGLVAIFIALSGSAVAANVATDSGKSGKAKKAAKGKRGPRGPAGPAGPAGAQGAQGPQGVQGAQGAPPAYAHIIGGSAPNTVDDPASSGITDANVVRQAAGLYCVYGLPFTPRHVQATHGLAGSGANTEIYADVTANTFGENGSCPNAPTVEQAIIFVDANNDPIGTFVGVDVPIYVAFYP